MISKSKNNRTPSGELFAVGKGAKPIAQKFARAAQIEKEYTPGFDDSALRRLAASDNLNPVTGQPWIPAPKSGLYEIAPTVRGVIAYQKHKLQTHSGLPDFASMELCETVGHIPRKTQKWLIDHGINFLKPGHRVDYEILMRGLSEKVLTPLFSGDTSKIAALGVSGMEYIDGEYQKSLGLKLDNDRKRREEDEAKGILQHREDCHAEIFSNQLLPVRKALITLAKKHGLLDELQKIFADNLKKLPAERLELQEQPAK